jgi:hypothetical protein
MDLLILAVIAAVATLLGIATQVWGVDSRSSFIDPRVSEPWVA